MKKNSSLFANGIITANGPFEKADVVEINRMAHGAVVGSAIIKQLQNSNEPVNVINDYISKLTKGTE